MVFFKCSQGNLSELGKLLMQGSFNVWTDHKKGASKVGTALQSSSESLSLSSSEALNRNFRMMMIHYKSCILYLFWHFSSLFLVAWCILLDYWMRVLTVPNTSQDSQLISFKFEFLFHVFKLFIHKWIKLKNNWNWGCISLQLYFSPLLIRHYNSHENFFRM